MLKEMISDPIYNSLEFIQRWSPRPRIHHESDATHLFYATLYTNKICRALKEHGVVVNRALAMSEALVHDTDEAITGDMPRHFKSRQKNNALQRIIRTAAQQALSPEDYRLWRTVQIGTSPEAQVVMLADWLSGLRFMLLEAKMGCGIILREGIDLLVQDANTLKEKCPICSCFFKEIDTIIDDLVYVYTNKERKAPDAER